MGDGFGKLVKVTKGLKNMYAVAEDIMSFVAWLAEYGGGRCCGEKSRDDIRLGSIQSGSW